MAKNGDLYLVFVDNKYDEGVYFANTQDEARTVVNKVRAREYEPNGPGTNCWTYKQILHTSIGSDDSGKEQIVERFPPGWRGGSDGSTKLLALAEKFEKMAHTPFSPDDEESSGIPGGHKGTKAEYGLPLAEIYGQDHYEIAQQAREAVFRVFGSHNIQPLDDTKFLLEAILKAGWGKP